MNENNLITATGRPELAPLFLLLPSAFKSNINVYSYFSSILIEMTCDCLCKQDA